MTTKTTPRAPVTQDSPREHILDELLEKTTTAAGMHAYCPDWGLAHERINVLLDWLVGR